MDDSGDRDSRHSGYTSIHQHSRWHQVYIYEENKKSERTSRE